MFVRFIPNLRIPALPGFTPHPSYLKKSPHKLRLLLHVTSCLVCDVLPASISLYMTTCPALILILRIRKVPINPASTAASYILQKLQVSCAHLVILPSLPKALIWLPKKKGGTKNIMVSTLHNFALHLTHVFWTKLVFLILSLPLIYGHFHETHHFSKCWILLIPMILFCIRALVFNLPKIVEKRKKWRIGR